jgi:hypothetical protein
MFPLLAALFLSVTDMALVMSDILFISSMSNECILHMAMKDFMMSSEAAMYPRTATGPVAKHVNKRKIIVEYCIAGVVG